MALIVEDGTGLPNAQSFCDIAFIDAYHSERGNAGWTGLTTAKEQAAIRATDYTEQRFSARYVGTRKTKEQARSWPRVGAKDRNGFVIAENEVPIQMKQAQAEYSLRALTTPLMPDPVSQTETGAVIRRKEVVGPLEEEVEYAPGTVDGTPMLPDYPAADALLAPILRNSSGRAVR